MDTSAAELKEALHDSDDFGAMLLNVMGSLASEGRTDEQISDFLGVELRTLKTWLRSSPLLRDYMSSVRGNVVAAVEHSLLKVALGYKTKEVKVAFDSQSGEFQQLTINKQYPPNVDACKFILKNLKPHKWKDRQEIDASIKQLPTVSNVAEAMSILANDPAKI